VETEVDEDGKGEVEPKALEAEKGE